MASVVQGSVVSHGSAPYKNDPANSDSYYVELQGDNDESRTLWGVGIRDAIQLKGIQNGQEVAFYDRGLAEGSKKRNWDVERFEKPKHYENSIEEGVSPTAEKTTSLDKTENHSLQRGKYNEADDEEELDLPAGIKNQYIYKIKNRALAGEKVNFYERDGEDGVVAFEDRNKSLHTSREDSKTIKSMLDVAQAKNWSSVNLKGTEAFKREAWLEAKVRGIEVKGFKPEEKDLVELQKRQEGRSYNEVIANEDRSREINTKAEAETEIKAETETEKSTSNDQVAEEKTEVSWDAVSAKREYGFDSDYKAGLIMDDYKTRGDFEKSITSFQEEFNTDRENTIKTLGEWAVNNDQDKDIDQKVWDANNQQTGYVEMEDDVKDAAKAVAVDASIATATGDAYTASSAVASVVEDKIQNEVVAKITENEVDQTRDDIIETQENTTTDHDISDLDDEAYQEDLEHEQREHEERLEQEKAEEQAEVEFGKAEAEWEGFMNSPEFDNLDDYRAWKQADDEAHLNKSVEQEALVRSNEFDIGRDVDPETEVEGDMEQFHENLAAPTGAGVSKQAAMMKVEAAFDKKVSPTQRNEVKENVEESLDDRQKIAIEAMRRVINERFKNDDIRLTEKHSALNEKIPDIAAGKFELEPPTITEQQTVEVEIKDKGSKDKSM